VSVWRSMGERRKMPIRKELATVTDLETGARVIPSGSDLYRQGDICCTYYVVLNGWIGLSVLLHDGSRQILDFALPCAVLAFQSRADAPISLRPLPVGRARLCFSAG
jgi:CRP-like cAMP-binding protein